jgi:hypothetical protein
MKTENEKKTGQSFTDQQQSTDTAINQRIKKGKGKPKLNPEEANNPWNRNLQTDTGNKKTGGGKQKGPGM